MEALIAKLTSTMDIEELSGRQKQGEQENTNANDDTIDGVFDRLSRLVNTAEAKYSISEARHEARGGRYATEMGFINMICESFYCNDCLKHSFCILIFALRSSQFGESHMDAYITEW